MRIRQATMRDFDRIIDIFRTEYKKPPYNENWKREFAEKKILGYFMNDKVDVAELKKVEGFIVSSTYWWFDGERGSIDELIVDSEVQGNGIGKKLIEHAEERFKKEGVKYDSLMVHTKSKAFQIYKKWGFEDEGFKFMIKELK